MWYVVGAVQRYVVGEFSAPLTAVQRYAFNSTDSSECYVVGTLCCGLLRGSSTGGGFSCSAFTSSIS